MTDVLNSDQDGVQQMQLIEKVTNYIEYNNNQIFVPMFNNEKSTTVNWHTPLSGSRANNMNPSFYGSDGGEYQFGINAGVSDFLTDQSYVEYTMKFPFVFDARNVPSYMDYGQYTQEGINIQLCRLGGESFDSATSTNNIAHEMLYEFGGGKYQLINGEWIYQLYSVDDDLNRIQMRLKGTEPPAAGQPITLTSSNESYQINELFYTNIHGAKKEALLKLAWDNIYYRNNWDGTFDSKRHVQVIEGFNLWDAAEKAEWKDKEIKGLYQKFGYYKINKDAPQLRQVVSTGPMNSMCVLSETAVQLQGINQRREKVNRFTTLAIQTHLSEDYQKTMPQTWFQHSDPTMECEFEPFILQRYNKGPLQGKLYKLNILFSDFVRILTGEVYDNPAQTDASKQYCRLTREYCEANGIYLRKMEPNPKYEANKDRESKYTLDSYYSVVVDITHTFQIPINCIHPVFSPTNIFPLSQAYNQLQLSLKFQPYTYNKIFGSDFRFEALHFKLERDQPIEKTCLGTNEQAKSFLGIFNNDTTLKNASGVSRNSQVCLIDINLVLVNKQDAAIQSAFQKKGLYCMPFIDYDYNVIASNPNTCDVCQEIPSPHQSLNDLIIDVCPDDINDYDSLYLHQYSTFKSATQILLILNGYKSSNLDTKYFSYFNWEREGPGDKLYSKEINKLNTFRFETIRSKNLVGDYSSSGNMNYASLKTFLMKQAALQFNLEQYGVVYNDDCKYDGRNTYRKKMLIKFKVGNYSSNINTDYPVSYGANENTLINNDSNYALGNYIITCYQLFDKILTGQLNVGGKWDMTEDRPREARVFQ